MRFIRFGLVLLLVALTGCVARTPIRAAMPTDLSVTTKAAPVRERNYVIGKEQAVYVGQPAVRVRDYEVMETASDAFVTPVAITFTMRPFGGPTTVPAGTQAVVHGVVAHQGQEYLALKFLQKDMALYPMLVDRNGRFAGLVYTLINGYAFESSPKNIVEYLPSDLVLTREVRKEVVKSGAFTNFELVYSGTTKDEINFLYREYTADDMARPAFSQNLVYSKDAAVVRFRDIVLDVIDANNENIRYVVRADGLVVP